MPRAGRMRARGSWLALVGGCCCCGGGGPAVQAVGVARSGWRLTLPAPLLQCPAMQRGVHGSAKDKDVLLVNGAWQPKLSMRVRGGSRASTRLA